MKLALRNYNDNFDNWDNIYSQNSSHSPINVQNIPAAVYVLRVTDTNGKEYNRKVVVD